MEPIEFELVNDLKVVVVARLWRFLLDVLRWAIIATIVAAVFGSIAAREPFFLVGGAVVALFLWPVRGGRRNVVPLSEARTHGGCVVRIGDAGVTISHPSLSEPLAVALDCIRVAGVELPKPGRDRRRYQRFELLRNPNRPDPLGEQRWLLNSDWNGPGRWMVELLVVGYRPGLPNAAILFTETRSVTTMSGTWPEPNVVHFRKLNETVEALIRWERTFETRGVYLRLIDPHGFDEALRQAGIRSGFTRDDWSYASGRE
jgi:hypothetical protein